MAVVAFGATQGMRCAAPPGNPRRLEHRPHDKVTRAPQPLGLAVSSSPAAARGSLRLSTSAVALARWHVFPLSA